MPERRARLDYAALALLLAGLLVALSVFSYDPADPPSPVVHPQRPTVTNLLGVPGAWLGRVLVETFGVAAYVLLASWFVLVVLLFVRRSLLTWTLRLAGWLLLVPCAAAAADFVGSPLLPGSLNGGGTLGAWLIGWLQASFYPVGQVAVYSGCLFLGLVLTADSAVSRVLKAMWRACCWMMRASFRASRWLWTRIRTRRTPRETSNTETKPVIKRAFKIEVPAPTVPEEPREPLPPPGDIPIRHHDAAIAGLEKHPEESKATIVPQVPVPIQRSVPQETEEERFADYELPPLTLLEEPQPFPYEAHDQQLRDRAALLEKTFSDFEMTVRVVGINTGPVITQYELALETGLRLHKVTSMADDLALNLKVPSVRIVAPIPGKNTVGVEIPNEHRAVVRLKEVILNAGKKLATTKIPLFLGKDTEGRPLVYDLAEMPHLLIAGRTGTGKSVCMNAIILSMLMTRRPDEVKMVMIDPKMLELSEYGRIPHLMHPVVKDMKKAEAILSWAVDKMEERYDLLSRARVRSIAGYNALPPEEIHRRVQPVDDEERGRLPDRIPYIVIFVDEMNDLMMTMKKEVEGHIIRLAQKSRAAGIHLVVATQKPTVDVITGLIKSNLPARICFQVSSRSDSRVVLDEMGADKLLGKGDMLFLQPGTSTLIRSQGTYASDEEITRVVQCLECDPCYAQELIQLSAGGKDGDGNFVDNLKSRDDLYEQAIEVIVREGRGSVSLLQRALGIGYGRGARLIDYMAEDGIVGDYNGSQAREVLYTPEEWQQVKQTGALAGR
ncbi:MAG TPA: DNA translocase FtsK 4TM domain-containing protein [Gemmataceae bacterium]|nr:DNA translocase FtsK 4TM domain-containing protein [Gemmataceae bacterium]